MLCHACGCILYVAEANKAAVVKQCSVYKSACFCPSGKRSDRWLEQFINIRFFYC